MTSQVTLLLVCMLVSEALALNCLQCVPQIWGICPSQETTCPDQCLTSTTSVQTGANMTNISVMTCGSPELCVNGSLNLGIIKITNNAKCCSTDLCNTETLPVLSEQDPNGRKCHVCDTTDCTGTVNCTGSEDRCITASVKQGSNAVFMKGCVSNSLCFASELSNTTSFIITEVKCCEGNLCNAGTGGSSGNGTVSGTGGSSGNGTLSGTGGSSGNGTVSGTGGSSGNGTVSGTGGSSGNGTVSGGSSGNGTVSGTGGSSGNDAESFTLSFLLMIVPLLSSILFH